MNLITHSRLAPPAGPHRFRCRGVYSDPISAATFDVLDDAGRVCAGTVTIEAPADVIGSLVPGRLYSIAIVEWLEPQPIDLPGEREIVGEDWRPMRGRAR